MQKRDRGAAAVEFALILVLLLTLFLSVIEGGRLFVMQANLSQAAREGVREIALHGDNSAGLAHADAAYIFGTPTADVLIGCAVPPVPGSDAKVVLSHAAGTLTGLIPITPILHGTGVMRCGG